MATAIEDMVLVCERCGVPVEDQAAHDQFHQDVAMMAAAVLRASWRGQQQDTLTLHRGIPAAGRCWGDGVNT